VRESAWEQKPSLDGFEFVGFFSPQCQCMQSSAMQKNPRYRICLEYHGKNVHSSFQRSQSFQVQFGFCETLSTHMRVSALSFGSMTASMGVAHE